MLYIVLQLFKLIFVALIRNLTYEFLCDLLDFFVVSLICRVKADLYLIILQLI